MMYYIETIFLENTIMSMLPIIKALFRNIFKFGEASSTCVLIYIIAHRIVKYDLKLIYYLNRESFDIYLYHEPIIHLCIYCFIITGFISYMDKSWYYLISIIIRFITSLCVVLAVNYIVKVIEKYISRGQYERIKNK